MHPPELTGIQGAVGGDDKTSNATAAPYRTNGAPIAA
jgi:hypothetical protein